MIFALLVVLCIVFRVVPHPPNFAPVGAVSVFAGRTMPPWVAFAVVVTGMFLGDVALAWMHGYPAVSAVTPFVYAGFGLQLLLGRALRGRRFGLVAAAALGSLAFFVSSNVGVWLFGHMYPRTSTGLVTCFVAAIPFFGATLASDVLWSLVLSMAHTALTKRFAPKATDAAQAA